MFHQSSTSSLHHGRGGEDVGFASEFLGHDSVSDKPLHSESSHLELPNIPGLRPSNIATLRKSASAHKQLVELQAQSRPQTSKMLDSYSSRSQISYFEDPEHFETLSKSISQFPSNASSFDDLRGRYSLRSQQSDRLRGVDRFASQSSVQSKRLAMRFYAFSVEKLPGNLMESERLHLFEVLMHPEDSTLEIKEAKAANSGIMPLALKRHRVVKPGLDSDDPNAAAYTIHDAFSGAVLKIYGVSYVLYDSDRHTRDYLNSIGLEFGRAFKPPTIKYKLGASINSLSNPSMSLSATMSSAPHDATTSNSSLTSKFLQMGSKVLRFYGFWVDSEGSIRRVKVHYFLADDTIEVVNIHEKNDGRDHAPTFLRRMRMRKPAQDVSSRDFSSSSIMGPEINASDSKYYMWTDLNIGTSIKVAGVSIQLLDCDAFTRQYYEEEMQIPLATPIHLEEPQEPVFKVCIPPHNGIGSEEDSLLSCSGSLILKPVRPNLAQLAKYAGICLRFKAKFVNPKNSDRAREFIIQAYPEDGSMLIQETAVRNSGFAGGKFLARMKHKNPDGSEFSLSSLYMGAIVEIRQHLFEIEDADERTLTFMESHPEIWSQSDTGAIRSRIKASRNALESLINRRLNDRDSASTSLTYAEARDLLYAAGVDVTLQESVTLFRQLDPSHQGSIPSKSLLM